MVIKCFSPTIGGPRLIATGGVSAPWTEMTMLKLVESFRTTDRDDDVKTG